MRNALPVRVDGDVVGVLTDREMTVHIAAARRDPAATLVRDVMNRDPAVLFEGRGLKAAGRAMGEKGTHRVFVVDGRRKLVGIGADNEKAAGKAVKTISRPRRKATA